MNEPIGRLVAADTGAVAADGLRDRFDGLGLADDVLADVFSRLSRYFASERMTFLVGTPVMRATRLRRHLRWSTVRRFSSWVGLQLCQLFIDLAGAGLFLGSFFVIFASTASSMRVLTSFSSFCRLADFRAGLALVDAQVAAVSSSRSMALSGMKRSLM
jgi:hypothetical protein